MRKSNLIIMLLLVLILGVCLVALTSCNNYDCSKDGHKFNDEGVCTVCGYVETGLEFQLNDDGESYSVVGIGTFTGTDLVIPSKHSDGKPVTNISERSFTGYNNLTSVTIPNSVTTIGYGAFDGCSNIESMVVPFTGATLDGTEDTNLGYIFGVLYYYSSGSMPDALKRVVVTGGSTISAYAFSGCTQLEYVEIPQSVTSIGASAFYNCKSLTSFVIPDSVTSIGGSAFANCRSLTTITIGSSVSEIGSSAFSHCYSLVEVYNRSSLNIRNKDFTPGEEVNDGGLRYYALDICTDNFVSKVSKDDDGYIIYTNDNEKILIGYTGMDSELVLPDGITKINHYAFYNSNWPHDTDQRHTNIVSITIPDSVTTIGSSAFRGLTNLMKVTIGSGVTRSDDILLFNHCYKLVEVYNRSSLVIVDSLEYEGIFDGYIDSAKNIYTSAGESKLSIDNDGYAIYTDGDDKILVGYTGNETELVLPKGITEINSYAFYNDTNITSVSIPASVTKIGNSAFYFCSKLSEIVGGDNIAYIGNGAFDGSVIGGSRQSGAVYIGKVLYKYNGGWSSKETSVEIKDGTVSIAFDAFYGCDGLIEIVIPDSVITIEQGAFSSCDNLMRITLGEGLTSIGKDAFAGCKSLLEVYNRSSLPIEAGSSDYGSVGYYAQAVYTGEYESKFTIDNGYVIYTDGDDKILVSYKGSETALILPNGITEINDSAFSDLDIVSIKIPEGVTKIGARAFWRCTSLTSVAIPDSVISIGAGAFDICWNLTSVTFGENSQLKEIGNDAFSWCYRLSQITIPDNVTTIGRSAFEWCFGLVNITLGSDVTNIEDGAFSTCYNLVEVYNKSDLSISVGSKDNGCIGFYAKAVYTSEYTSKLSKDNNGYLIYTDNDNKILIGYVGDEEALVVPEGITAINKYAFYANNISSISIPQSLIEIGESAFIACGELEKIYYDGTISQWNLIVLGENWKDKERDYTIYCTDGTIAKDGTITYYSETQE